ncbi:MAG TPA: hypothetical protein VJI33_02025 [Candidatus Paceibacterota bacterium]
MIEALEKIEKDQEAAFAELKGLFYRKTKVENYNDPAVFARLEKIVSFSRSLASVHGREKLIDCKLYHLITGSSDYVKAKDLDLPDGSIERFIKEEL